MEYEIDTVLEPNSDGGARQNPNYASDTELEPNAANPSKNSVIANATGSQSEVSPEDYPEAERDAGRALVIPEEEDES